MWYTNISIKLFSSSYYDIKHGVAGAASVFESILINLKTFDVYSTERLTWDIVF